MGVAKPLFEDPEGGHFRLRGCMDSPQLLARPGLQTLKAAVDHAVTKGQAALEHSARKAVASRGGSRAPDCQPLMYMISRLIVPQKAIVMDHGGDGMCMEFSRKRPEPRLVLRPIGGRSSVWHVLYSQGATHLNGAQRSAESPPGSSQQRPVWGAGTQIFSSVLCLHFTWALDPGKAEGKKKRKKSNCM